MISADDDLLPRSEQFHASVFVGRGAAGTGKRDVDLLYPSRDEHPFLSSVRKLEQDLQQLRGNTSDHPSQSEKVCIDGSSLDIAQLVACARYDVPVKRSQNLSVEDRIQDSIDFLQNHLAEGNQVYGVSTGFGGSADVRTKDYTSLQQALIQMQNAAILLRRDTGKPGSQASLQSLKSHALPREVVKGAMLARANSLLRGHSAVRLEIIDMLNAFINADMIPIVPLRGSISASGDLTPLSYIAGALEGNPDIYVQAGPQDDYKIYNARDACAKICHEPVLLEAKEGLGLLNGTAVSTSAASLVHHDASRLALLSQYLTAMAAESLRGSRDNYHPFIAKVRPHQGQIESASIIHAALEGSKLAQSHDPKDDDGLYQDRYALRTATQWIGPQLEDLELSTRQLNVELNSTTDNPLIDAEAGLIHHGGNFQAASVSSAMERTRILLQMLGKLLFSQTSQILNSSMNGVLPPNLVFDDPSTSYSFKGVDINMASYMSEIGYLANPVTSHVQSAEMHNQQLNSLALISARYAADSVELLSLMSATHLYVCCQALDLQVFHLKFVERVEKLVADVCREIMPGSEGVESFLTKSITKYWVEHKSLDLIERCKQTVSSAVHAFISAWTLDEINYRGKTNRMPDIKEWGQTMTLRLEETVISTRQTFVASGPDTTMQYLGQGTKTLYSYVRNTLGIKMFKGLVEHPLHSGRLHGLEVRKEDQSTLGSSIAIVYEDIRAGGLVNLLTKAPPTRAVESL